MSSDGMKLSQKAKEGVMALHSGLFRSLPLSVQEQFHKDAAVKASRNASALQGDKQNVEASLALHFARTRQEVEEQGFTNRTAQHWFDKHDLQKLHGSLIEFSPMLRRGQTNFAQGQSAGSAGERQSIFRRSLQRSGVNDRTRCEEFQESYF